MGDSRIQLGCSGWIETAELGVWGHTTVPLGRTVPAKGG